MFACRVSNVCVHRLLIRVKYLCMCMCVCVCVRSCVRGCVLYAHQEQMRLRHAVSTLAVQVAHTRHTCRRMYITLRAVSRLVLLYMYIYKCVLYRLCSHMK